LPSVLQWMQRCVAVFQVCSTMVAEHLVSDLLEQSNLQELNGSEKQFEVETERLNSRLEHARANNAVLALTLHESKAQCDRYDQMHCQSDSRSYSTIKNSFLFFPV